ncbi:MAG: hypothetical protein ACFFDT_21525, partial [Candidatus Hodarchaeota archaeon]
MNTKTMEKLTFLTGKNGCPPRCSKFTGNRVFEKQFKNITDNISHPDIFDSTSTSHSLIIIKKDNNTKIGLYIFISFISIVHLLTILIPKLVK